MKNFTLLALTLLANSALAAGPAFNNLSKSDVENVSKEFAANFSHTVVAAPETNGIWGIEVGLAGGRSASPELKDIVEESGSDGSDFGNLFHAGVIARAHFPFDLYAELSLLPEQEISDVTIKNNSIGFGWNAGSYFGLPLDVAVGAGLSSSSISFSQIGDGSTTVTSDIDLESKTRILYAGVSKTFLFVTPYLKVGTASAKSSLDATGSILSYSAAQSEDVESSGSYLALGANLQFLLMRFGFEMSSVMGIKGASAKLSLAF